MQVLIEVLLPLDPVSLPMTPLLPMQPPLANRPWEIRLGWAYPTLAGQHQSFLGLSTEG